VGKSTLARDVAALYGAVHYFDLERPRDLARLEDAEAALEGLEGLVILDEAQQKPALFPLLRFLVDRQGTPVRFLILGSVLPTLRQQAAESLAGRVHYHNLSGLGLPEVGQASLNRLWVRGGFPNAYTATDDRVSMRWREDFIQTYLERDLSVLGFDSPPVVLRRFWTMLAHLHGQELNIRRLAGSLGETPYKAKKYLDALTSTFMVRQLQPRFANTKKRQVKAPKVYIADTGLLHALLGLETKDDLLSHPVAGASWESFAMADVMARQGLTERECYFWATHSGAELDLFVQRGHEQIGYEFKLSTAPRTTKSMHSAVATLALDRLYVVHPGDGCWPMGEKIEALGLSRSV
jgi:predicted AAA+ superfamily ATPase